MLQCTAAATAEMRARRSGSSFTPGQPIDDPPFPSAATAGAEPRADAVARHREGQKDRLAIVLGDSVPARPDPLDQKLDDLIGVSPIPVATPRHHLFFVL